MRSGSWIVVMLAVFAAVPFGWGLGVVAAYLIAGPDFGQLPAMTVPLGIVAGIVFALAPRLSPSRRLTLMLGGTALFALIAWLTG